MSAAAAALRPEGSVGPAGSAARGIVGERKEGGKAVLARCMPGAGRAVLGGLERGGRSVGVSGPRRSVGSGRRRRLLSGGDGGRGGLPRGKAAPAAAGGGAGRGRGGGAGLWACAALPGLAERHGAGYERSGAPGPGGEDLAAAGRGRGARAGPQGEWAAAGAGAAERCLPPVGSWRRRAGGPSLRSSARAARGPDGTRFGPGNGGPGLQERGGGAWVGWREPGGLNCCDF